eukprot:SAG11_NODE_2615_length_3170_cov_1.628460_2_plen_232_part_00
MDVFPGRCIAIRMMVSAKMALFCRSCFDSNDAAHLHAVSKNLHAGFEEASKQLTGNSVTAGGAPEPEPPVAILRYREPYGAHRPVCGGRCLVAHVGTNNLSWVTVLVIFPAAICWSVYVGPYYGVFARSVCRSQCHPALLCAASVRRPSGTVGNTGLDFGVWSLDFASRSVVFQLLQTTVAIRGADGAPPTRTTRPPSRTAHPARGVAGALIQRRWRAQRERYSSRCTCRT